MRLFYSILIGACCISSMSLHAQRSITMEKIELSENNTIADLRVHDKNIRNCDIIFMQPYLIDNKDTIMLESYIRTGKQARKYFNRERELQSDVLIWPFLENIKPKDLNEVLSDYKIKLMLPNLKNWSQSSILVKIYDIDVCKSECIISTIGIKGLTTSLVSATSQSISYTNTLDLQSIHPTTSSIIDESFIFYFKVNSSGIDLDYATNTKMLNKLHAYMTEIANDDSNLKSISLDISNSPEGTFYDNEGLVGKRVIKAQDFWNQNFKLYPCSVAQVEPEDWTLLTKLIENYEGTNINKQKVLNIIQNYAVFQGRESQLMTLNNGVDYKIIAKDLFPLLRFARFNVKIEKQAKASTISSDETKAIDYANEALKKGNIEEALRLINPYINNPNMLNTLGIIALKKGDFSTAQRYFIQAELNGSKEASANLQIISKL